MRKGKRISNILLDFEKKVTLFLKVDVNYQHKQNLYNNAIDSDLYID